MKNLMVLVAFLNALFLVQTAFGQGNLPFDPNNPPPDYVRRNDESRKALDRLNGKDERGMIANRENLRRADLPRTKRDKPYTKEEIAKIKSLLKPNEADSAKYADFLKQPKTGMFRLFPFLPCIEKGLIRVDGECANFIENSWSYSFRAKDYSDARNYFDIKFKDGNLISGSMLSLGILTSLGDAPIENISLASDVMKFLAGLKLETEQKENERQIAEFAKGVEAGGYKYSNKIKIEASTTYGLRVVAYRMPDNVRLVLGADTPLGQMTKSSYPLNKFDERDDIIIAFRVVRREESDGNITILWKELSRADAPKLVFPKDVKRVMVKTNE